MPPKNEGSKITDVDEKELVEIPGSQKVHFVQVDNQNTVVMHVFDARMHLLDQI